MQKWEHMAIVQEYDWELETHVWDQKAEERTPLERLNELGEEGWQLAAGDSLSSKEGVMDDIHIFYLKRPISE